MNFVKKSKMSWKVRIKDKNHKYTFEYWSLLFPLFIMIDTIAVMIVVVISIRFIVIDIVAAVGIIVIDVLPMIRQILILLKLFLIDQNEVNEINTEVIICQILDYLLIIKLTAWIQISITLMTQMINADLIID